jgi:thiamine-phosphate pyrophosphorylase
MTDERMGDALMSAIAALPRGSGIIFRHYLLNPADRAALFRTVQRQARRHRHVLLFGGSAREARRVGADGHHQRSPRAGSRLHSAAVHNRRERIAAERLGVDLIFVSPVFATASHPGARPLGARGFGALSYKSKVPVIALGGMTRARFKALAGLKAYGWAAIDGLMP